MSKGIGAIIGLLSILILLASLVSAYDGSQSDIMAITGRSGISQSATNTAVFEGSGNNVNQAISQTAVSQYSQYYTIPTGSAPKAHIEAPKKHDIKGKTPNTVYFSYQMQAVPYSQYQTYATYTGGNSLWIQGDTSWAQYAAVPQGASLSLLATSSTGGNGYLYEITPDGQLMKNNYYFFPGYNQLEFYADTIRQHILLFAVNDQVSNAIVINVVGYYPPYLQPGPIIGPILPPIPPSGLTPIPTSGDTPVTIVSQSMRGYQVFLNGNYIGTEGSGGDPLDGRFSFNLEGNQYHDIRVFDSQFNYQKSIFFPRKVQKIINVEPGTAVYI